jgi:hypothetical protein
MTLLVEAPPTTVVVEPPEHPAATFAASNSWASAAARAHALLSQTMPDEEVDQLLDRAVRFEEAVVLPRFFFG